MSEARTGLSKSVLFLIALITLVVSAGGYGLFFQSQKRIIAKDRQYQVLNNKLAHTQEELSSLQHTLQQKQSDIEQQKRVLQNLKKSYKQQKSTMMN